VFQIARIYVETVEKLIVQDGILTGFTCPAIWAGLGWAKKSHHWQSNLIMR
jgi:hypothetical protein